MRMPFSWVLQGFYPSKKGPRRSKSGGRSKIADRNMYSTELGSINHLGAFPKTPAKISGPMGARFLSSTGLECGTLVGRGQFISGLALDKNRSPIETLAHRNRSDFCDLRL